MPCFAPHQRFSGVGGSAACATPTPLTPGPTVVRRRLDRAWGAGNGRGRRTTPAIHDDRAAQGRAIKIGEEIA
jgi:hypothetical protein